MKRIQIAILLFRHETFLNAVSMTLYGLVNLVKLAIPWCRSPHQVAQGRMGACLCCDIYDIHMDTCGTIGTLDKNGEPVGCWCHMPTKVYVRTARCWMRPRGKDKWTRTNT